MKIIYIVLAITFLIGCTESDVNSLGHIYGIVNSTISGEPIRNATVTLTPTGKTAMTGSDGNFGYIDLTPAQYTIQVSATGYKTNTKTIIVESDAITRCDIPLSPGATEINISPKVLDFGTNATRKSVTIYNNGSENIIWELTDNCDWIFDVSPKNGTLPANSNISISVTVDRNKLIKDEDLGLIQLTTTDGDGLSITAQIKKKTEGRQDSGTDDPLPPAQTVTNGLYVYYNFEQNTKDQMERKLNAIAINEPKYVKESPDGSYALSLSYSNNSYINIPEGLLDKKTHQSPFG